MSRTSATTTEVEEKSLDFRLFLGFHACMMITVLAHYFFKIDTGTEAVIAGGVTAVAIILSVRNRLKNEWHWPGTRGRDLLWAFAAALLVAFLFGAPMPGRSPLDPKLFPWCAMGVGFVVFAVLGGLHIICQTEKEFQQQCGSDIRAIPRPTVPPPPRTWQSMVSNVFQAYFLLVWIAAVGFFWRFNAAFRQGSPVATATQTEQLSNHGKIIFISLHDWQQVHLLERALTLGIPSAFVIGGFLHFVARVKVFSRTAD